MASLTNFVYCLNAERKPPMQGEGDSINAIGILSVMTPEFVPGTFSFSIIFSVLGVDTTKANELRVVFKDDSQNKILVNTENISVPSMPNKDDIQLPAECVGYNLSMDFRNVVFESNGYYTTEIYLNNESIGSRSIYVKGRG